MSLPSPTLGACAAISALVGEGEDATLGMLEREIAEIDENMIRRRLPVLERGRQLARRKELYEALHPEARQHVRGGNVKAAAATERISPAPAFATDAAAKLGTSDRTVQEEIRIATALAPDAAELVRGTPLEDEKVRLMELTRLPLDQQGAVARLLVEGRAKSVRAALATIRRTAEAGEAPASEGKSKGHAERAWGVLRRLRAAEDLLSGFRAEEVPSNKLAEEEMDAAKLQLAAARAQVEVLLSLLSPRGRAPRRADGPLANVIARPGPSSVQPSSRWEPKYVWTLHRNPANLRGPVLAVRRRVLAHDRIMIVKIARRPVRVFRHILKEHGCARTSGMLAKTGGYEVCVWVYDHCPTAAERAEWLRRRAIENAALTSPPPDVWVLRKGPSPSGPDQAVQYKTTRAWRSRDEACDVARSSLEVEIPGDQPARIDLFELLTEGQASDPDEGCRCFYRDPPTPEDLRRSGDERRRHAEQARLEAEARRRHEEERAQARSEQSRRQFDETLRHGAGEEALRAFGLTLPCTIDDVNRAFRKRVREQRVHPDQGGSDESMRDLAKLRERAVAYAEMSAETKPAAHCA